MNGHVFVTDINRVALEVEYTQKERDRSVTISRCQAMTVVKINSEARHSERDTHEGSYCSFEIGEESVNEMINREVVAVELETVLAQINVSVCSCVA